MQPLSFGLFVMPAVTSTQSSLTRSKPLKWFKENILLSMEMLSAGRGSAQTRLGAAAGSCCECKSLFGCRITQVIGKPNSLIYLTELMNV